MEKYEYTPEQRAVLEGMQAPFAIYQFLNKRVVTLIVSDGFRKLLGYDDFAQAYYDMDNDMYKDAHPDDVARIADAAVRFATQGGKYETVYRSRRSGQPGYFVIHAQGEHFLTETGVRLACVWYTDEGEYTERTPSEGFGITGALSNALHEQSILKANQYDYLTGLPSMTYFFELADAGKAAFREKGVRSALLYTDFSGMKFFNDRHGFAQGDRMLRAFARLLANIFGSENCCRIGADHFAAIAAEEGLEDKLNGLFRKFGALCEGQTPPIHVGIYPQGLEKIPVSTACDRAKLACTRLRGSYSSGFSYYSAAMSEDAAHRQHIIENIDRAIREKWIRVYYQPIIRAVTEKVCDEEALARWIDPKEGFLSPAEFIPVLEEAKLIYKLDLYMLEQVLEDIRFMQEKGLYVVPRSINLSRSDFEVCDIVEEIRKRVDAAGVARDRITVEVTESIIGSDFEYMKKQVERFRSLGFPVWMDDFGSGYSSLDVLQSIRFDLIKFDKSFMDKFYEGDSARTILNELMKMATDLGVATVCEGVETEEQVRYLQEIGCSRLQGFYFQKPSPLEKLLAWNSEHQDSVENPAEAEYYDSVGSVNLYNLAVLAQENDDSLQNAFNTLPMGIIEVKGDSTRFMRSNQSYRDFIKRFFHFELSALGTGYAKYDVSFMYNVVKACCEQGVRSLYSETMPDGSLVHSLARRIGVNPVTGSVAVVIAVLSVSEPGEGTTYADIARALAADYHRIYVVDLDTEKYIEYISVAGAEVLAVERHGTDFFSAARRDALTQIYEKDREMFLSWFSRENILRELDARGSANSTYRLMVDGEPMYVTMKVTRMSKGGNRIIFGVSVIDSYMRQKERYEEMEKERDTMARIMALSEGYLSLYTVEPETGHYVETSWSEDFESLGATRAGNDFFRQSALDAERVLYEGDRERFIRQFTCENVLKKIREEGKFRLDYRLMIGGTARDVTLKAALFREGGEEKMVVGIREWQAHG